jgi:hypothetical protein
MAGIFRPFFLCRIAHEVTGLWPRIQAQWNRDPAAIRGTNPHARKNFFIIFVDAIFTTLFERLFTKVFDGTDASSANTCVYRACNVD